MFQAAKLTAVVLSILVVGADANAQAPATSGVITISGFVRDLDGTALSASHAATETGDPTLANTFSVNVTGQIVGERNVLIGPQVSGSFDRISGAYELRFVLSPAAKAKRADIRFEATVDGFDIVSQPRISLQRSLTIDVVMPRSSLPSCQRRCRLFGRRH